MDWTYDVAAALGFAVAAVAAAVVAVAVVEMVVAAAAAALHYELLVMGSVELCKWNKILQW
jgi:hypothetical protein